MPLWPGCSGQLVGLEGLQVSWNPHRRSEFAAEHGNGGTELAAELGRCRERCHGLLLFSKGKHVGKVFEA